MPGWPSSMPDGYDEYMAYELVVSIVATPMMLGSDIIDFLIGKPWMCSFMPMHCACSVKSGSPSVSMCSFVHRLLNGCPPDNHDRAAKEPAPLLHVLEATWMSNIRLLEGKGPLK